MAINVTKPAINLREKLNEVTLETGIKGEELLNSDTSAQARNVLELDTHLFTDFESTGIDDNATSTKLATTTTGIDVTGSVTCDGATVEGNIVHKGSSPDHYYETGSAHYNFRVATQESTDSGYVISSGTQSSNAVTDTYTPRLTIKGDTGSVGIGVTPNASSTLHVGKSGGSPELWLERTDGYTPVKLIGNTLGNGQGFKINVNNGDRLAIDSAGNVGIGTTAPIASANKTVLGIQGAWGGQVDIMVGTTSHAQFGTDNYGSGLGARIQSKDGIVFKVNGGTEKIRITSSGNVGIGTTAPGSLLQVGNIGSVGAITTNKNVITNVGGGYSTATALQYNLSAFTATTNNSDPFSAPTGETAKNFYHGLLSNNGYFNTPRYSIINNGVERLTINQAGNVGIGTIAPASKLDVVGDIQTSGFVKCANGYGIHFGNTTPDGTTVTSEVLDDYEEGTWTPTFLNTTVSAGPSKTTGRYTKIGNIVHVEYYGSNMTFATAGAMTIGGLPFTVANSNSYSTFQYVHGTASSDITTGGYFTADNTTMYSVIQGSTSPANWITGGTRYLMVAGTYTVA